MYKYNALRETVEVRYSVFLAREIINLFATYCLAENPSLNVPCVLTPAYNYVSKFYS